MNLYQEENVLKQIEKWALEEECIRAVVLTGSRTAATSNTDLLSDYDIAVYTTDWSQFLNSDNWINRFGTILVRWPITPGTTFDTHWLTRLVLFEDGLRIDFQITEFDQINPKDYDNGYRILVDKDGITNPLKEPTYTIYNIKRPSKDEFTQLVNDFWWDTTYLPKNLYRNELPYAKYMLDNILRHQHLHRLIEWHIGSINDWKVNPGCHGKWFALYLDHATWEAYKATYAGSGINENWNALFKLLNLFGRLASKCADRLGYQYPADLDKKVTGYIYELHQMYTDSL
ncbi:MAG: aminoglycoside 6-adenylyltransferase [Chromatiales bacterium]|nr:aminoglycoside 6-adenylyltransferase [Chromatiales bacterium]